MPTVPREKRGLPGEKAQPGQSWWQNKGGDSSSSSSYLGTRFFIKIQNVNGLPTMNI